MRSKSLTIYPLPYSTISYLSNQLICPILSYPIPSNLSTSQAEQLAALRHGILRTSSSVAQHAGVGEDLIVVATRKGLISKKVNFVIFPIMDIVKSVSFIPALREDVEGDLAADRVG